MASTALATTKNTSGNGDGHGATGAASISSSRVFQSASGVYTSPRAPVDLSPHLGQAHCSLPQFLLSLERHSGRPALIDAPTGRAMFAEELQGRAMAVAAGLERIAVSQGDVVMLLAPNSLDYPVVFLAVMMLGAAVTTVNPLNTRGEVEKQAKDSKSKLAVTVASLVDKVSGLGLPVVLIDGKPKEEQPFFSLTELLQAGTRGFKPVRIHQDDTAALLYSSGTTGTSKGVVLSHRNLISAALIHSASGPGPEQGEVYLCVIPMFHVFGFVIITCTQLNRGVPIVVMPQFDFEGMLGAIQRYRITNIPVVPPIIIALCKSPLVNKYDLSSLREIGSGAAPLGKEVIEACTARFPGVTLRQGYGLTESTAIATVAVAGDTQHYGSAGMLSPNTQAKVVDIETGKPLPPNKEGEIWLRGPTIMRGYLNNPKATAETVDAEGWLHTGDLGYIDEGGNIYVVDRIKELIKYKGFQVAPAELEALLLSHPQVLDVAVIPYPDEEAGQVPLAAVVRQAGSNLDEEAVKSFVSDQVAPYKKVRKVIFVTTIPKSASGKILRRELIQMSASRL